MPKIPRNWVGCLLALAAVLQALSLDADARMTRNAEERAIARLVTKHRQQGRPRMTHDAYLHLVARAKAKDMARRDYFGHTDPDGYTPNRVLRLTGYGLPEFYGSANSIESIVAGTNYTPSVAFNAWMGSPGHRRHLLAEDTFYQDQTRFGVGYASSSRSQLKNYYVFISAPPSTTPLAAISKSLRKLFLNKTPKQIERSRQRKR